MICKSTSLSCVGLAWLGLADMAFLLGCRRAGWMGFLHGKYVNII